MLVSATLKGVLEIVNQSIRNFALPAAFEYTPPDATITSFGCPEQVVGCDD
jgi:hypothetical protein